MYSYMYSNCIMRTFNGLAPQIQKAGWWHPSTTTKWCCLLTMDGGGRALAAQTRGSLPPRLEMITHTHFPQGFVVLRGTGAICCAVRVCWLLRAGWQAVPPRQDKNGVSSSCVGRHMGDTTDACHRSGQRIPLHNQTTYVSRADGQLLLPLIGVSAHFS